MVDILSTEIQYLNGIGPKRAKILASELNILTFRDLLYTFPYRYIDRSRIYAIAELDADMTYIQLRGKVRTMNIIGAKRGRRLVIYFYDDTGSIELVFFKGIKWIQEKIKANTEYIVFGKTSAFNGKYNMVHPEIDEVTESQMPYGSSMTGIYSSTDKLKNAGITIKTFSKFEYSFISKYLEQIHESLPAMVIKENNLCPLKFALKNIHFPTNMQALGQAQYRLKFEELFYLQLSLLKQKNVRMNESVGHVFTRIGDYFNTCFNNIPYELTNAQKRVIHEIREDMRSSKQMNRLLQGDVGSGKTLVAILSAMIAADNGFQTCIMAPTEVLATQHYEGIFALIKNSSIKVELLTGSVKTAKRREIHAGLEDGSINILFGTHAVIEDNVKFKNLGFVVIDEQHRFGVAQRAKLRTKADISPHILVMTATPIPRTLAMTVFGNLEISVLDELPPGRKPVQTIHVTENQKDRVYSFIKKEIDTGRQVFIVYPLIKESEKMDYKNLQDGYEEITSIFKPPKYVTAIVHGKQKNEDKAYDMKLFVEGKANILVSTTVIEVGVDIPNASLMIIASAERFGLSQLHQLRGRVGRGSDKSYCILMTGYKMSKESKRRIELMCYTNDGFELAEEDMKMRGPGDIEGTRQSGLAIPLHIAQLGKDSAILSLARKRAIGILHNDPLLKAKENQLFNYQIERLRNETDITDYSKIS
ncbi:MAG: ATP-dependent DNA helicase RecG [Bacteroidales bacterium]